MNGSLDAERICSFCRKIKLTCCHSWNWSSPRTYAGFWSSTFPLNHLWRNHQAWGAKKWLKTRCCGKALESSPSSLILMKRSPAKYLWESKNQLLRAAKKHKSYQVFTCQTRTPNEAEEWLWIETEQLDTYKVQYEVQVGFSAASWKMPCVPWSKDSVRWWPSHHDFWLLIHIGNATCLHRFINSIHIVSPLGKQGPRGPRVEGPRAISVDLYGGRIPSAMTAMTCSCKHLKAILNRSMNIHEYCITCQTCLTNLYNLYNLSNLSNLYILYNLYAANPTFARIGSRISFDMLKSLRRASVFYFPKPKTLNP